MTSRQSDLYCLLALLAISLVFNVWMFRERQETSDHHIQNHRPLTRGRPLPALSVRSPDGLPVTIRWNAQRSTLVYVFTTTCVWCERNYPNFTVLLKTLTTTHRVIPVALDGQNLATYIARHPLGVQVFHSPDERTREAYQMGTVPQTLLISGDGVLIEHWSGAYSPGMQEQIEKAFRLTLPGLRTD